MLVVWIIVIVDLIFYVWYKKLKEYGDNFYCFDDWLDFEIM